MLKELFHTTLSEYKDAAEYTKKIKTLRIQINIVGTASGIECGE
jgi:hypothetical protein